MTQRAASKVFVALGALGALTAVLAGCNGGAQTSAPASPTSTGNGPREVVRDCAAGPATALADDDRKSVLGEPGMDPEIVKLAQAALTCDWGTGGFMFSCQALKDYQSQPRLRLFESKQTLVRMLEDRNERVRYLGGMKLQFDFKTSDKELARRLVTAARKETSPIVARQIGGALAGVDFEATGIFSDVEELTKSHPLFDFRAGLVSRALRQQSSSRDVFKLTAELAKDPNQNVAMSAVSSLASAAKDFPNDVCPALAAVMRSSQESVASSATMHVGTIACASHRDAFLDAAEAQLSSPRMSPFGLGRALENTCKASDANGAQKTRSASVAEQILKNDKSFHGARIDAMKAILACEPARGVQVVAAYQHDKDEMVRNAATDMVKGQAIR
ncbi:MAG: hypothetical protein HOW73_10670 [Polyangiaceae bacterium]|nr:hypothetical protein [Polyangiaceae bacterium]